MAGSTNLDQFLPLSGGLDNGRPHGRQVIDQLFLCRIAKAEPHHWRTRWIKRSHGDEILILRHDDGPGRSCCSGTTHVCHVLGFMALRPEVHGP